MKIKKWDQPQPLQNKPFLPGWTICSSKYNHHRTWRVNGCIFIFSSEFGRQKPWKEAQELIKTQRKAEIKEREHGRCPGLISRIRNPGSYPFAHLFLHLSCSRSLLKYHNLLSKGFKFFHHPHCILTPPSLLTAVVRVLANTMVSGFGNIKGLIKQWVQEKQWKCACIYYWREKKHQRPERAIFASVDNLLS